MRGRIKRDLRKYMSNNDLIGRQGGKTIKIPISRIDIPRFRLGSAQGGSGTGQGPGEVGDAIGGDGDGEGTGPGEAGQDEGAKELEHEVTLDELAEIMAEELELPNIEPKGAKDIQTSSVKYSGVRPVGPESLRNFKRTYKQAIRRMVAAGQYDPDNPVVVPRREDRRYRSWSVEAEPVTQAVIIYMMDVSGSMGDEQKEIVRMASFWLDTWLRSQYKGIESRYIIHDATAREVDRDTFFHTRESGGTMISSAYNVCLDIMQRDYPISEWNVYPFHFSDGDNWSGEDTEHCIRLLKEQIIPGSNMFSYGQVDSPYGSGQFLKDLASNFDGEEKLTMSEIRNREMIYDAMKDFLGKGL